MRRRRIGLMWSSLLTAALVVLPGTAVATADTARSGPSAKIRYTEHGVPHILAADFLGLGYGYGYAVAKDNICTLADSYLTVGAQRARYFGAGGIGNPTLSSATSNLNSDLHFQRINDSGIVEQLIAQAAPKGPRQEVRDIVSGYVQGYNRYLSENGAAGISDPACRGAEWLRPIADIDVYRVIYALTLSAGQGTLADGIVNAQPPTAAAAGTGTGTASAVATKKNAARFAAKLNKALGAGDLGSNGIAIGSQGVARGKSLLLGNPHFPWRGASRFWQTQLTVPGKMNVSGAGLLGTPFIIKGYNDAVAWTHTLATPRTFGLYEVKLASDDPTAYLVDGVREQMTGTTVRVQVKNADGTLSEVSRTLYSTRYGPMLNSAVGMSLPWTGTSGYAVRDGNLNNVRALNTWFQMAGARSTNDIVTALSATQGAPWNNTLATDRNGNALYADIQVVPGVPDELVQTCGTPMGKYLFPSTGLPLLDGSLSSCAWQTDSDSLEPGLFGPARLPRLTRSDYAANSNDSAWLVNSHAPITGYPRIVGDIGTARSPRTRENIISVEEGLANGKFTRQSMQDMLFRDRSRMAVLAADATAAMCAAFPDGMAPSSSGPVDVGQACPALAAWDHTYSLDSRGSLLFERFAMKLGSVPGGPWSVPFNANDPLNTPNTLRTSSTDVQTAFGNAAVELRSANIPLDARLGDYQFVIRGTERIPLHGGSWDVGVLNVIHPQWDPRYGNVDVRTGTAYIQVVGFDSTPCPDSVTLLASSQSSDSSSPYYADQTKLFSAGQWVQGRYCEDDILASPEYRVIQLS